MAGVLSAGLLGADPAEPLSVDTGCRFDTEYVQRGARLNQQVFIPRVEVSASLFGQGDVYFGGRFFLSTRNQRFEDHTFYVGVSGELCDPLTLDARFIHHIRRNRYRWLSEVPQEPVAKRRSEEIGVGLLADVFLNPSLYYFYDFTWRRHNLEGKVNYLYDLSPHGIDHLALDFSARVGCDRTGRPFSFRGAFGTGSRFQGLKKNYFYYGAGADLIYTLNEHALARAGVEYEGANGKKAWIAKISEKYRRNLLWFSTSLECSF